MSFEDNPADEIQITKEEWQAGEIARLESELANVKLRLLSAAGDDLCRLTQEEIKAYSSGAVKIPPKEEFIASCERFHSQIAGEAGVLENCLTLAQLIAENQKQTDIIYEAKEVARKALDFCQIVCPPSPGERGTYDADMGRMFRDLLAKDRATAQAERQRVEGERNGAIKLYESELLRSNTIAERCESAEARLTLAGELVEAVKAWIRVGEGSVEAEAVDAALAKLTKDGGGG